MSTGTNVRAGRSTRAIIGIQAAKGTALAALGGASAIKVRAPRASWPAGEEFSDPAWNSDSDGAGSDEASHLIPAAKRGEILVRPTPATVEYLFRSHWGPLSLGAFERKTQVYQWLTLAFVENRFASVGRLVRFSDAWVHALRFEVESSGRCLLAAAYAAEASDVRSLAALSGVTLPAAPMEPADQNEFPGRSGVLTRDPAGDAEELPFARVSIEFDGGLRSRKFPSDTNPSVYSSGHRRVSLNVEGRIGDELWQLIDASRAGTREAYRLEVAAPSPAKTFAVDLASVTWNPDSLSVSRTSYDSFGASGVALANDAGDFVDLTLS